MCVNMCVLLQKTSLAPSHSFVVQNQHFFLKSTTLRKVDFPANAFMQTLLGTFTLARTRSPFSCEPAQT